MTICYCDTETYSDVPIKNGTHAYSKGAEILIWTYAFDDGEVKVWDLTRDKIMPADLKAAIDNPEATFVFHNSFFDLTLIREVLKLEIPINQVHCTMAQALSHSLPGSLGRLCEVMGVKSDKAKDKDGRRLVRLFCMPLPKRATLRTIYKARFPEEFRQLNKIDDLTNVALQLGGIVGMDCSDLKRPAIMEMLGGSLTRATSTTHPEEWEKFIHYAMQDIEAMRDIYKRMPRWNYPDNKFEYELWQLDYKINTRGFLVDTELARAAIAAVEIEQQRLKDRTGELTQGDLYSTSQRDKTLEYILKEYGVSLPDLQVATLERRLYDQELPPIVRELIAIRLQSSKTSTAKYQALINAVSDDGRLRGTLQFNGAARTGRWCLAEGTLILVKAIDGTILEKAIENVLLTDTTFDGDNWVSHEGVVYSGEKEVIEYDNIVATSEHNVYISTSEHITLAEAKAKDIKLWRGNYGL